MARRSLCCTTYALARNREMATIDALGESEPYLAGRRRDPREPAFCALLFRTDLLSTRKCLRPGASVSG